MWYFHKLVNGKRIFNGRKTPFSLETSDLIVAKAKRDALLKVAGGAELDRVLGRSSRKPATLQEIVDAYMLADAPREKTRKKYVRCLRLILKKGAGRDPNFNQLTIADLTSHVVHDYQDAVIAAGRAAGHDDLSEEMLTAKYSANRTLTQARSIFAGEKPFRKLHAPRPAGFLDADDFAVKRDLSFVPLDTVESALFVAKSAGLKAAAGTDPYAAGVYLVFLCMRWLGLRNSEVEACKPAEWITETPRGWVMRITNRPYFVVKGAGSIRDLPLADWLREELLGLSTGREWLIPGETATDRHDVTHRALNDWMGTVYDAALADGTLPSTATRRHAYDWRKQAGTELYAKTKDILLVSKWLGHTSVHTTTRWYVNLIGSLPSLA